MNDCQSKLEKNCDLRWSDQQNQTLIFPYYRAMDGLRAIAIGIVLLAHARSPFPKSGGVGVDIFFVLSGFLITTILVKDHTTTGIHFRNFYIRRFLRLVPCLILTCLLVYVGRILFKGDFNILPTIVALTYTANWVQAFTQIELGGLEHCWSLSIEEQYYLLWPFAISMLQKHSKNNLVNSLTLVCLSLLLALYRSSIVHLYSPSRIYFGLDTHMDGIVLGGAAAYFVLFCRKVQLSSTACKILSHILTPISISALLCIMWNWQWTNPWMGRLGYTIAAVASAIIIVDIAISDRSLIKAGLEFSPLVSVGKISYGVYLLHCPAFVLVDRVWQGQNLAIAIAIKVLFSIVIAAVSYRYIELPFLCLKRKFNGPSAEVEERREITTSALAA